MLAVRRSRFRKQHVAKRSTVRKTSRKTPRRSTRAVVPVQAGRHGPAVDIGIPSAQREVVAVALTHLLADTYALYLKTHNFHWNVTGPMFQTPHLMFEQQYNEWALAVDLIAERLRALDHVAPGSYTEYSTPTSILESTDVPKATEMVDQLAAGQEALVRTAFKAAEAASDQVTMDLLTQRMQIREKTRWMLRSLLE